MKELENKIIEFVQKRGWNQLEHPECLIKSISIEAGELLECIQWDNDYKTEKAGILGMDTFGGMEEIIEGFRSAL